MDFTDKAALTSLMVIGIGLVLHDCFPARLNKLPVKLFKALVWIWVLTILQLIFLAFFKIWS